MATTLITRETTGGGATVKNAPLTNPEVDLNFISLADNKVEIIDGTVAVIPDGTTAERPGTPAAGMLRFNTTESEFEGYNGVEWGAIGGGSEIQNETASTSNFYPTLADVTSGDLEVAYVSDTKLFYQPSTGTLNATTFNSLSDASVKTNINEISNGLDVINAISGVEFDWKDNGGHSAGVVAQELEKVLPHLVATTDEGMKSVNYAGLTAYLLSAIRELSTKLNK